MQENKDINYQLPVNNYISSAPEAIEPFCSINEYCFFIYYLLFIGAGGAFGGVLRDIVNNEPSHCIDLKRKKFWRIFFRSITIGIGGAVSVHLALYWLDKFPVALTYPYALQTLFLSVVAGYIGKNLLNSVSSKIEKQLAGVEHNLNQTKAEIQEHIDTIQKETDLSLLITTMSSSIDKSTTPFQLKILTEKAVSLLEEINYSHRNLTVLTGRIYRRLSDLETDQQKKQNYLKDAIKILTHYINENSTTETPDLADIIYNRACYRTLMSGMIKDEDPRKSKELTDLAIEDLQKSIDICPENKVSASEDEDLKLIFQKI